MTGRKPFGFSGNALMEYALPMAIILVIAGVLATVMDINGIIGKYFMASSGNSSSSLEGTTFKPKAFSGSGSLGNGAGGFDGFGKQIDGNGTPIPWSLSGGMYTGAVPRPQTVGGTGTEFIYPVQINWGPSGGGAPVPDNAPNELKARVMAMAETTRQLGNAQQNGDTAANNYATAQLMAQQAGTAAYAASHPDEVMLMNASDFQQVMNLSSQSIDSGGTENGYMYEPWLTQQWQQEQGQWNVNQSSPGQSACGQDYSSCQNTAAMASMSIEMLIAMGIPPEVIYGSMINTINNQAATPLNEDAFFDWWLGGSSNDYTTNKNAMLSEYN